MVHPRCALANLDARLTGLPPRHAARADRSRAGDGTGSVGRRVTAPVAASMWDMPTSGGHLRGDVRPRPRRGRRLAPFVGRGTQKWATRPLGRRREALRTAKLLSLVEYP